MKINILILAAFLVSSVAFYSCKKDKSNNTLIGVWEGHRVATGSQVYADTFVFNADSSFTESKTLKDTVSGKTLGYQYLCTGKFRTSGQALTLTASSTKMSNDYGPIGNLSEVQFVTINVMHYTLVFQNNNNSFYFENPPCPPNASCLATLNFYRQ